MNLIQNFTHGKNVTVRVSGNRVAIRYLPPDFDGKPFIFKFEKNNILATEYKGLHPKADGAVRVTSITNAAGEKVCSTAKENTKDVPTAGIYEIVFLHEKDGIKFYAELRSEIVGNEKCFVSPRTFPNRKPRVAHKAPESSKGWLKRFIAWFW